MALLQDLIAQIADPVLRERILLETNKLLKQKKFGLVFEEHLPECTPLYEVPVRVGSTVALKTGTISDLYTVLNIEGKEALCERRETRERQTFLVDDLVVAASFGEPIYPYLKQVDTVCNDPDSNLWHTLIEADNYHALQLLEYLYAGKVDCIYIDPPYNTGARDWKYNNDYVDSSDAYRHSKWLSMMEKRLKIAKKLLNPKDSVLIVTIDEKEYLHLGCLLEEMFTNASIQMVSTVINSKGVARDEFFRVNEYIYILRFGNCLASALSLPDEWRGNIRLSTTKKVRWGSLMRSGTNSLRTDSPSCFYPIFISNDKKHFCGVGDILSPNISRSTVKVPAGQIALFPIHSNDIEGCWQYSRDRFLEIQKKGYVRISTQTSKEATLRYISEGWQKKVENGQITVIGKAEDGSLIFDDSDYIQEYIPCNQWWIPSHNATEFGSKFLKNFIGSRPFPFPKSLYAVHDTIRFFVANKPNALIVDFFAGSGTTLHAVNLLNAGDSGSRRCILITNNEVSDDEAKTLKKQGYKPGDEEWEQLGIARYVTWPRTVCSIKGQDVNGAPLKGNYLGSDMPMAKGFKANAIYFKLGFLDKTLVALDTQFKELLSVLWMKAGAIGPCPALTAQELPNMLILPENRFAVLLEEAFWPEFSTRLTAHPEIQTVFLVTDSDATYKEMTRELEEKVTYQLYKDYLENFRINRGR